MPCAGSNVKDSFVHLSFRGSFITSEGAMVASTLQICLMENYGVCERADEGQLLLHFEAGDNADDSEDAEREGSTGRGGAKLRHSTSGLDGKDGVRAVRILVDSAALERARCLLIPALDELPDVTDLLCSIPLLRCALWRGEEQGLTPRGVRMQIASRCLNLIHCPCIPALTFSALLASLAPPSTCSLSASPSPSDRAHKHARAHAAERYRG
jgi:hypothetical protein